LQLRSFLGIPIEKSRDPSSLSKKGSNIEKALARQKTSDNKVKKILYFQIQ
jgi:hypothetical protein